MSKKLGIGAGGGVNLAAANTFTVGPQTIQTGAAGNKGLIVRGAASQTASLQEWQDSAAAIRLLVNSNSDVEIYNAGALQGTLSGQATGTQLLLPSGGGFTVKGTSGGGQFLRLNNTANNTFFIGVDGIPQWELAGNVQTTVGAAGGASAPPASPTKYLKVKDDAGTTLVIPAYAAS